MDARALDTRDTLDPHLHLVHDTDELSWDDMVLEEGPWDDELSLEPAPVAPPRRGGALRTVGLLGGGAVIGGGLVAAVSAAVTLALVGAGVVAWFALSGTAEPVEAEAAVIEAVAEPEEVVDADLVEEAAPEIEAPRADAAPRSAAPAPAAPEPPAAAPVQAASAAPTAPAEPAAPQVVKLLTDPPAATVRVNGAPAGRSPLKLELTPGSHQISIEAGKASGDFTVQVGSSTDRLCFGARGRKVFETDC